MTRSWYNRIVKRVFFFPVLILTGYLVGCSGDELTVDMSKTVTDTNAPPVNLSAEVARSNNENKLLLLEFSSSDSCPPCVLLQQRVFSTPEFEAFEKTNLNFVRLDYPQKTNLRPDTTATNDLLAKQFDVYGFPTFVAIGRDGKEFWRTVGLPDASFFEPTNFINLITEAEKKGK